MISMVLFLLIKITHIVHFVVDITHNVRYNEDS